MYVYIYVFIAHEWGEGQRYLPLQHPCPLPLLLLPHGNTTYHLFSLGPTSHSWQTLIIFFIQFECPLNNEDFIHYSFSTLYFLGVTVSLKLSTVDYVLRYSWMHLVSSTSPPEKKIPWNHSRKNYLFPHN